MLRSSLCLLPFQESRRYDNYDRSLGIDGEDIKDETIVWLTR